MATAKRSGPLARLPPELSVAALALFWPLEQIAANAGKIHASELARPLGLIAVVALILSVLAAVIARHRVAGAYVAVGWVMLFWAAGGLAGAAGRLGVPGGYGDAAVVVVALGGLVLARFLGKHLEGDPGARGRLGGLLAIVAAVFFLPVLTRTLLALATPAPPPIEFPGPPPVAALAADAPRPDVYLVLLDAYARSDVLQAHFGVDDRPFRRRLVDLGFQVGLGATANYTGTLHSVSSLLNLDYLPDTELWATAHPKDHRPLRAPLAAPHLAALARAAGYRLRLVSTGSDVWIPGAFDEVVDPGPRAVEHLLVALSAAGELRPGWFHARHRRRIREALAAAPADAAGPPAFTLLHLMNPHPPFVFGADCGPSDDTVPFLFNVDGAPLLDPITRPGYYREAYGAQVECLGGLVGDLVEGLVRRPDRPAVVWIFGDHGPRALPLDAPAEDLLRERTAILHALHVPPGVKVVVPRPASLVQTARALARGVYGATLPVLPRRVFLHDSSNEYRLFERPAPGRVSPPAASSGP